MSSGIPPYQNIRYDPRVLCNKCKRSFSPYNGRYAPTLDEVACPNCGEKRIIYYGDNPEIAKLLLSNMGINNEVLQKLTELENQITLLREFMNKSIVDAKNMMTGALIASVKDELEQHEHNYHNVKPPKKP